MYIALKGGGVRQIPVGDNLMVTRDGVGDGLVLSHEGVHALDCAAAIRVANASDAAQGKPHSQGEDKSEREVLSHIKAPCLL
jgi:hypothetical protein